MKIARTIREIRSQVGGWRSQGLTIGAVPTMGALHEGHLSLIDASRRRCRRTLATLFVNPIQFAVGEDFSAYPRQEGRDAALLEMRRCDLLFAPAVEEIFPDGYGQPTRFKSSVIVHGLSDVLCGVSRPGHFHGVSTQVLKLLLISLPDAAFFGEKDYQQLQVVRRMVRDLNVPSEIVGCPTVREADGLAMSSRNAYLKDAERRIAPMLYRVLCESGKRLRNGAEASEVAADGTRTLIEGGFQGVDYLSLADAESLEAMDRLDRPARLLAAAKLGQARLIDNIRLEP